MEPENKCPVSHGSESQHTNGAMSNNQWWPDQLNLNILHQHDEKSNPNPPPWPPALPSTAAWPNWS